MTKDNNSKNGEQLLTFPTDFTLKIIGRSDSNFDREAITIINKYFANLDEGAITVRSSKQSKYTALSVTVHAESQEQLDKLYSDLSSSPDIIFVL